MTTLDENRISLNNLHRLLFILYSLNKDNDYTRQSLYNKKNSISKVNRRLQKIS